MWYLEDFWELRARSYSGKLTWYLRKGLQSNLWQKAICCSETQIVLKELSIWVKEFVSLKLLCFCYKAILKQARRDFRSHKRRKETNPADYFLSSRQLVLQIWSVHYSQMRKRTLFDKRLLKYGGKINVDILHCPNMILFHDVSLLLQCKQELWLVAISLSLMQKKTLRT